MASFAPGTSQAQMEDYYRRMPRSLGGSIPDDQHPYGLPGNDSGSAGFAAYRTSPGRPQGGAWNSGPIPGTRMYRPPVTPPSAPGTQGRPSSFRAGQAQSQQSPYATATPYGIDPNVANRQGAGRPQPFQATYQNFDGTQSSQPNFQQRDAFINQINNQLGQMQNQSWQRPGMGAPQFNFPQMWGQAGDMVQQGWQNPLSAQPPQSRLRRPPSALGELAPGSSGRPMSPEMQDILRRNPGVVF